MVYSRFGKAGWIIILCWMSVTAWGQQAGEWGFSKFVRPVTTPVIIPNSQSTFTDPISGKPVHWEALHTFNPAAVVHGNKIAVLYRAEDDSGEMKVGGHTSRLGLAESVDGIHFERMATPVFYPDKDEQQPREDPGGVEDPRVVQSENGMYVLTYTQYNRNSGQYTIGLATSNDLHSWKKYGPIFAGRKGYEVLKYKSSGIVTQLKSGRMIAAKIAGKYWMYWGEVQIHVASSPDLIHWAPVESSPGVPLVLLEQRNGLFDSGFPETGPPPLLTTKGILMLYNAKNAEGAAGDKTLAAGGYSVGQALFAPGDPIKLLSRAAKPVLKPEMPSEQSGQYAAGTTFAEGLVYFKGRWWLYYGCADSFVGVAVSDDLLH